MCTDYTGAEFPGVYEFLPALYTCIAMSIARFVLHRLIFKVHLYDLAYLSSLHHLY
jgi:hypothetical protein